MRPKANGSCFRVSFLTLSSFGYHCLQVHVSQAHRIPLVCSLVVRVLSPVSSSLMGSSECD